MYQAGWPGPERSAGPGCVSNKKLPDNRDCVSELLAPCKNVSDRKFPTSALRSEFNSDCPGASCSLREPGPTLRFGPGHPPYAQSPSPASSLCVPNAQSPIPNSQFPVTH